MASTGSDIGAEQRATGLAFGTPGYRSYVLLTLTFVYTLNFIDRVLIGVVAQPIIDEFRLQDWQFGLLTGFGFAVMYTLAGIPIARLAERVNRVKIIAVSIIIWSAMTALCGIAGSFIALLAFRIGVGIGEAGCTPPSNSLIADYYPPRSRAKALATYAMGVTIGGVLANLFGGPIAEAFSWREAFLILGLPGILVGIIVWFSVQEPPRGYSDPPGTPHVEALGIGATLVELGRKPTYWMNVIGATLVAFVGYGINNFQAPFFQRVHGLSVAEVATQISVPLGIAATIGTFGAGYVVEKISPRYPGAIGWLTGVLLLASVPFYWLGFSSESARTAAILIGIGAMLHYGYLGAQYTICQGVANSRSRATAIAIMLFIVNLIGYGLGPLTLGFLSDLFATQSLAAADIAMSTCKADPASLAEAIKASCAAASADGLRSAIKLIGLILGLAGIAYLLTTRTLQRDLIAKMD